MLAEMCMATPRIKYKYHATRPPSAGLFSVSDSEFLHALRGERDLAPFSTQRFAGVLEAGDEEPLRAEKLSVC